MPGPYLTKFGSGGIGSRWFSVRAQDLGGLRSRCYYSAGLHSFMPPFLTITGYNSPPQRYPHSFKELVRTWEGAGAWGGGGGIIVIHSIMAAIVRLYVPAIGVRTLWHLPGAQLLCRGNLLGNLMKSFDGI